MRSVVEKSYRQVKPETHATIMCGLVSMTSYISVHVLATLDLRKWIKPLYLSLVAIGVCYVLITWLVVSRRQKKGGFVPLIAKQIAWIWLIIVFHPVFWDMMGLFKNIFCQAGFIYAMTVSIILGVVGVLHSKEWLFGGILVFAGMLLAFFVKDYAFIILGLATGAGCIIPAIIVDRNYRKWAKENEQA